MESNEDRNLKAIQESVGRLVWVRLRNSSWWPGQILLPDHQNSPKLGTPIKLLAREDVSVDWYVLEKSKLVKPFRCGEYDSCIDKAKASAALASSSNKKSVKCTRRENAINTALEIENTHLAREETDSEEVEEDRLDSAMEMLQSSMSSQEINVQTKRRRRTPNDSEDDGTEGIKRMRGLEDIGKEHVGAIVEMDPVSNGNVLSNGKKGCSPLSLKRNRSQVVNVNECTKRKNRRRQLTKVLESTAMVCVPVTCDQIGSSASRGVYDSKVTRIESLESMRSVSVVINNNSDSTGVSCENANENVVGASQNNNKAKDSEISSVSHSMEEDDSSDQLYDVPLAAEETHFAGFPVACTTSSLSTALVSGLTTRRGRSSQDVFVKEELNYGSAYTDTGRQLVNCNSNGIEKRTSKWQLKGKRNSRQMSKNQEARRNVYDKEANENRPLVPLSSLYEVKIEVKADCSKPHSVPLVSRMSELNGKAIVGRPLTVEVLEEGYCNNGMGMSQAQVVVKEKSLSSKKKGKKKSKKPLKSKKSSLSKKTRRLSSLTSQNQKVTEKNKKQTTTKAKETVVACIPLKVVFSRINQVLKGSSRQSQHRALLSGSRT